MSGIHQILWCTTRTGIASLSKAKYGTGNASLGPLFGTSRTVEVRTIPSGPLEPSVLMAAKATDSVPLLVPTSHRGSVYFCLSHTITASISCTCFELSRNPVKYFLSDGGAKETTTNPFFAKSSLLRIKKFPFLLSRVEVKFTRPFPPVNSIATATGFCGCNSSKLSVTPFRVGI